MPRTDEWIMHGASQFKTNWPTSPKTATLQIKYLHSNGRSYRIDSDVTIEEALLRCLTFRRSLAEEPNGG